MATPFSIWDASGTYVLLTGFSVWRWVERYPRHSVVPWIFARGIVERHLRERGGYALDSLHRELTGDTLPSLHELHWQRLSRLLAELERSAVLLQEPRRRASAPPKTADKSKDASSDFEPVKVVDAYTVELLTAEGFPVPETRFEATFATGEKWSGTLDEKGTATRLDPPPGAVQIRYPDTDDILAKTLAVRVRRGWEARSYGALFDLLSRDPDTVQQAVSAYDAHFNDLGGGGFRQDVQDTFTDPVAYDVVATLLSRSGISLPDAPTYHDWQSQDSA